MKKKLFDSHCHLYDDHYDEYKEELISQINDSEIKYLTDIGTDIFTCRKVVEDTQKYDFCYGAVGYYPEDTGICPHDIFMAVDAEKEDNISAEYELNNTEDSAETAGTFGRKDESLIEESEEYKAKIREYEMMSLEEYNSFIKTYQGEILKYQNRKYEAAKALLFSSNGAPVMSEEMLTALAAMYRENPKIVALGEIGLDYHDPEWYAPRSVQKYWFIRQIKLAVELNAPICIHTRDADEETFEILKNEALGKIPVLLHCYSGSAELARQYIKLGANISLSGTVTYKNARKAVEVAQAVPLEKLLIETDAPYLTPVPKRGSENKPFYVSYTCSKIAEIKGLPYETVAAQTLKNALDFYRIKEN